MSERYGRSSYDPRWQFHSETNLLLKRSSGLLTDEPRFAAGCRAAAAVVINVSTDICSVNFSPKNNSSLDALCTLRCHYLLLSSLTHRVTSCQRICFSELCTQFLIRCIVCHLLLQTNLDSSLFTKKPPKNTCLMIFLLLCRCCRSFRRACSPLWPRS